MDGEFVAPGRAQTVASKPQIDPGLVVQRSQIHTGSIQMFDGLEGVFVSREIRLNFVRANRL